MENNEQRSCEWNEQIKGNGYSYQTGCGYRVDVTEIMGDCKYCIFCGAEILTKFSLPRYKQMGCANKENGE